MNLKGFFRLKSIEDKIKEYTQLYTCREELKEKGDELAEDFDKANSLLKSIVNADDPEGVAVKYAATMSEHAQKVKESCNKIVKIEKSMSKIENDPKMSEVIENVKSLLKFKTLKSKGIINDKIYNDVLKAINGKVKFADFVITNSDWINSVYPRNFGKILLLERIENGTPTGKYCLPGGHVELGETPREAALRELQEETGIILDKPNQYIDINKVDVQSAGVYETPEIEINYFRATVKTLDIPIVMDSEESASYKWVDLCDLDKIDFQYDNCRTQIKRIFGIDKIEDLNRITKSFAANEISVKVFEDFCSKNSELIAKANKHYFSEKEREELANKKEALPDGSFPIRNEQDLKDAIKAVGLAKDPTKAKEWIIKRAKELKKIDLLPEDWGVEKAVSVEGASPVIPESIEDTPKKLPIEKSVLDLPETQKNAVLELLYSRFAEEIEAWYQYWIVSAFMRGKQRSSVEKTFLEQATDELNDHATKILERISELGGDISKINSLDKLKDVSKCIYQTPVAPYDVPTLVDQNIISEECAIKGYDELTKLTQNSDPTTYYMALEILKDEEEHLRALKDFKDDFMSYGGQTNVEVTEETKL